VFAAALGVHVSSVYRWEKSGDKCRMDDLHWAIVTGIDDKRGSQRTGKDLGEKVRLAIIASPPHRSTLAALRVLIDFLMPPESKRHG
jgi:hypothetical protein